MAALDCGLLSVLSQLEHIYHELTKPAEIFGDDEQKPGKPVLIFNSKLYDELNEKLGECVSHALKGKLSLFYFYNLRHKSNYFTCFAEWLQDHIVSCNIFCRQ